MAEQMPNSWDATSPEASVNHSPRLLRPDPFFTRTLRCWPSSTHSTSNVNAQGITQSADRQHANRQLHFSSIPSSSGT
ncbi:hypothetical protein AGRA3207_004823 [Actinomadura graeca]|uniref:Uncharacterized protein n=1 Tax=Actinomadura graeca TaxID=2750812 RepID=A0ABX8QXX9_9ACTN|nr:hypothetical protein [Actinomadura graeca]QXJ23640.1 hypothetical protein AGRA3207_004823 [Actinomadura graeca]